VVRNVGDVDAAFARASQMHEAEYYVPHLAHAPMEPPAAVTEYKDGKVVVIADERFGLAVFPAVMSRAQLARALAERGVFDEGDAHGQEAIWIAEALDHPFSVIVGCLDLAHLKSVRGNLSQAIHLLERAVTQCREWNITTHTPPGI